MKEEAVRYGTKGRDKQKTTHYKGKEEVWEEEGEEEEEGARRR